MSDLENTSNNEAVNPNDALCTIEMINYQGAREEIDIWGQLDIYESMYDRSISFLFLGMLLLTHVITFSSAFSEVSIR